LNVYILYLFESYLSKESSTRLMRTRLVPRLNLIRGLIAIAAVAAIYILYVAVNAAPLPFASPLPVATPTAALSPTPVSPLATPPPHSLHFPDIPLYPHALLVDYRQAEWPQETYIIADGSDFDNVLGFYRAEMPKALFKHVRELEDADVYYKDDKFYLIAAGQKEGDVYLYISLTPEPTPVP
jgi:hypothetical protein